MGLLYLLFFNKEEVTVEPFDDSALRLEIQVKDSLADHWQDIARTQQIIALKALSERDSIEVSKTNTKIYYREIYKFNSTATNSQLDSVIRANW